MAPQVGIGVGDFYEDARHHPMLCVAADGDALTGVSLVDGQLGHADASDDFTTPMTRDEAIARRLAWKSPQGPGTRLRQLGQDELEERQVTVEVIGTLEGDAAPFLRALGIAFHGEEQYAPGPSTVAAIETPDGTRYGLRWFYDRPDAWIWVMAARTDEETPRPAMQRFLSVAGLGWELVMAVNDQWAPEGGRRGESAAWESLRVEEGGRGLVFEGLRMPEGGPWYLDRVTLTEHDDLVEAEVKVTNVGTGEGDTTAWARLAAPLGDRAVVDGFAARLVRPQRVPPGVVPEPVPWRSAELHEGRLLVRWKTAMSNAFAGVDVDLDGDRAVVRVLEWRHGGRLGSEQRLAVVSAPGVTPSTEIVAG